MQNGLATRSIVRRRGTYPVNQAFFSILLAAPLLVSCASVPRTKCSASDAELEASSVAVRASLSGSFVTGAKVEDLTITSEHEHPLSDRRNLLREGFHEASPAVIDDFVSSNRTPCVFERSQLPWPSISHKAVARHFRVRSLFGFHGWSSFARMNPDHPALVRVSRVGLTDTQALVYVEVHCGLLCGWGTYLLLERHREEWAVTRLVHTWES